MHAFKKYCDECKKEMGLHNYHIADANKKVDTGETEDWLVELREIVARGLSESAPYQYLQLSDLIRKTLAKERESLLEEVVENMTVYFIEWRKEVDKAYEEGRKTRKSQVLMSFPIWLAEKLSTLKQKGKS